MNKPHKATVNVKGTAVKVLVDRERDYISLTDIARFNDPGFNPIEFDGIRKSAGLNRFILTVKKLKK